MRPRSNPSRFSGFDAVQKPFKRLPSSTPVSTGLKSGVNQDQGSDFEISGLNRVRKVFSIAGAGRLPAFFTVVSCDLPRRD
jgi:hypothetical protein